MLLFGSHTILTALITACFSSSSPLQSATLIIRSDESLPILHTIISTALFCAAFSLAHVHVWAVFMAHHERTLACDEKSVFPEEGT